MAIELEEKVNIGLAGTSTPSPRDSADLDRQFQSILGEIQPIMLRTSEYAAGYTLDDWLADSPLVEVSFAD